MFKHSSSFCYEKYKAWHDNNAFEMEVEMMTKRVNKGSQNQNSARNGGKLETEFGQDMASGDNNKGTEYNSNRGSKSQLKNPNNH